MVAGRWEDTLAKGHGQGLPWTGAVQCRRLEHGIASSDVEMQSRDVSGSWATGLPDPFLGLLKHVAALAVC